jgi:hypothetical protein
VIQVFAKRKKIYFDLNNMITLTEKTYVVKDSAYTRKFVDGANGITIP